MFIERAVVCDDRLAACDGPERDARGEYHTGGCERDGAAVEEVSRAGAKSGILCSRWKAHCRWRPCGRPLYRGTGAEEGEIFLDGCACQPPLYTGGFR